MKKKEYVIIYSLSYSLILSAISYPALAANFQVSTEAELQSAIAAANLLTESSFLELKQDITLTSALAPVVNTLTVQGNSHILDGGGNQIFSVNTGVSLFQITNITVTNGGQIAIGSGVDSIFNNVILDTTPIAVASSADITLSGNTSLVNSDLQLQGSGNLVLQASNGELLNLASNIQGAGIWNIRTEGSGGFINLGGTNNQILGDTYVKGGNLVITGAGSLGAGATVYLSGGGVLGLGNGVDISKKINLLDSTGQVFVGATTSLPPILFTATLSGSTQGTGSLSKKGEGTLNLTGMLKHSGNMSIDEGMLVINDNASLGSANVVLNGGTLVYGAAFDDLKNIKITSKGTLDNGGFNINYGSTLSGWADEVVLNFQGAGKTTLISSTENLSGGSTNILSGSVEGSIAQGALNVGSDANYQLVRRQQVQSVSGGGAIDLASNQLVIQAPVTVPATPPTAFTGVIAGTGSLLFTQKDSTAVVAGNVATYREMFLGGNNTFTGGTTVSDGVLLNLQSENALGFSGGTEKPVVTLNNGAILLNNTTLNIDLQIINSGMVKTVADQVFTGNLVGNGDFYKVGAGLLLLQNNNNNFSGNVIVSGDQSLIGFTDINALGTTPNIQLNNGGGIQAQNTADLKKITIGAGSGYIDTNGFTISTTKDDPTTLANEAGDITGSSADSQLVKAGNGSLVILSNVIMPSGIIVEKGNLQIGNGLAADAGKGNVLTSQINLINANSQLVLNRFDDFSLGSQIAGVGSVRKLGAGTVVLNNGIQANAFSGGLLIEQGLVDALGANALGTGIVTLAGGGVILRNDSAQDFVLNATGLLSVMNSDVVRYSGNVSGLGALHKVGSGTLIYQNVAGEKGAVFVDEGTLQVGEALRGSLASDVSVNGGATLIFGRDDITQYDKVVSGAGDVRKKGLGTLVFTNAQTFTGAMHIDKGAVSLEGNGSLAGDVDISKNASLNLDRLDDFILLSNTSGQGSLQKNGLGNVTVLGNLNHTGGTTISSGVLEIGNGGTQGSIMGDVITNTGVQLAINHSDNVSLSTNLSGAGFLVQKGTGVTTITGTNTLAGGVIIQAGTLVTNSDSQLGLGTLQIDGGTYRYGAAFDNLRDIRVGSNGVVLDTNGKDVTYRNIISGNGGFTKDGLGKMVFAGSLTTTQLSVRKGEFQVGDGNKLDALAAIINISQDATFSLNIANDITLGGELNGTGLFRQRNGGVLTLKDDFSSFQGTMQIDNGGLNLNTNLGGDLILQAGTTVTGTGTLLGDLTVNGAAIIPGNSLGKLTVNGNVTMSPGSQFVVEIDNTNKSDLLAVGGNVTLAGALNLKPIFGNYTQAGCCRYTILTANSVTGTFSNVTNDTLEDAFEFLTTKVNYLPKSVDVVFARNSEAFASVAKTYNQRQVATALDTIEQNNANNALSTSFAFFSADQARSAFDSLNGDGLQAAFNVSARAANHFSALLQDHGSRLGLSSRGRQQNLVQMFENVRQGLNSDNVDWSFVNANQRFAYNAVTSKFEGAWVDAGMISWQENEDSTLGSAQAKLTGQMISFGTDGYWRDNLLVGFAAGVLNGNICICNRSSSSTVSGQLLGAYARFDGKGGWSYKATLGLASQKLTTSRTVSISSSSALAISSPSQTSTSMSFEVSKPQNWKDFSVRPFASMYYQQSKQSAFSESGAAERDLSVAASSVNNGFFSLGADISRPWISSNTARWAQWQASLSLMQPFGTTQPTQTASLNVANNEVPFTVQSSGNYSLNIKASLGGQWYLSQSLAMSAGYTGVFSSSTQEHIAVVSGQYRW